MESGLIGIDNRRLGVEKIKAQVFGVEDFIPELLEIREYFATENNIESNGGKEELNILGVGHHENIAAGFLHFFHVVNEGADATATEKGHFIEIEYDMRASDFHHFVDLGV